MVTGYKNNNLQQFWKTWGPLLGGSLYVLHHDQPILWPDNQWQASWAICHWQYGIELNLEAL